MKIKFDEVIDRLYSIEVYFTVGNKEFQKVVQAITDDEYVDDTEGETTGITILYEGRKLVIYIADRTLEFDNFERNGVIAHEAYHALRHIKKVIGENKPNHEMDAYLIQYITEELTRKVDIKVSKKNNNKR